jgi:CBS domain-containing protein
VLPVAKEIAMRISELMTTQVESIGPTKTLRQAARKMSQTEVGVLPIVADGKLLGVVTDRDICVYAAAMGRDPNSTEVQKVMSRELSACYEDQDITVAAELMEDNHIRRVMVLNKQDILTGILSIDDLARASHQLAGTVLESAIAIH